MKRALALARRGLGRSSPNPLVGAVVVRDGQVVGEGYHVFARRDHAEVVALRQAGLQASGADLYVTLEPCAHYGRTPPCTDRMIEAGIKRVFVATRDLNPRVKGKGIEALRAHGIEVHEGLLGEEAHRLNEAFFHYVQTGTPFVTLKLALTLDGKLATSSGQSQWITGPRARQQGHRLRYASDAILVGVETLLQDDPSLTVRWRRRNPITRVILDSRLRTPAEARLFLAPDPVLIFHARGSEAGAHPLGKKAELIPVQRREEGLDWEEILRELGRRNLISLLVEGGARVAATALKAGTVQKVVLFYGPRLLGSAGKSGVGDLGIRSLQEAFTLRELRLSRLGDDFKVEGYLQGKVPGELE